ncbi:hypothetical protein BGZ63DRAFT_419170 [Mariannaea sp. PMI_226]|nr:hypothetical protein BGZ63DRAFT_419170 [Mariannaea sp. PMI_226]
METSAAISIKRPISSPVQKIPVKQLRCFYEPLILLKALTDISSIQGNIKFPDRRPEPRTEEEIFCQYVDKLASMCDREKRGRTVTGITVLDTDDAYIYVLACNQVTEPELWETARFVKKILTEIDRASQLTSDEELSSARNGIHKKLLLFNRPRISDYVTYMKGDLKQCIDSCAKSNYKAGPEVAKDLKRLEKITENLVLDMVDNEEYIDACLSCLAGIRSFETTTKRFIEQLADEGRAPDDSMSCWSELRHHLTRLMAYDDAVTIFMEIGQRWPELFQTFKIDAVLSSKPNSKPLSKKSEEASKILGRVTADPKDIEHYRTLAKRLQVEHFSLDERIKKQIERSSFRPIVHCEILVLDWILREFGRPVFFENFMYIGTSKGACKLCDYYFKAHPRSIKVRPSHGNVYTSWAFPDVYTTDEAGATQRRQKILNSMKASVRDDAIAILEGKATPGKVHDSSTNALTENLWGNLEDEVGDVENGTMEELVMNSLQRRFASLSHRNVSASPDFDDEGGGASLN